MEGRGVARDDVQAVHWLRKAEEGVRAGKGGSVARQAMLALAKMYVMGQGGLEADQAKADELFRLAGK